MPVATRSPSSLADRDLAVWMRNTKGEIPPSLVGASLTFYVSKDKGPSQLYLFGGRLVDTRKLQHDLYVLDLASLRWTNITRAASTDGPSPRYFHSADVWNDHLVLYGGMGYTSHLGAEVNETLLVLSDVHLFHFPTQRWSTVSVDPASLNAPTPRYAHVSCVAEGRLVIVGGQDLKTDYVQEVNIFDLKSREWIAREKLIGDREQRGMYRSVCVNGGVEGSATEESVLLYSNYNFTDVRRTLESFIPPSRLDEGGLSLEDRSTAMAASVARGAPSPPGLRFPTGARLGRWLLFGGVYLASSVQEYCLWALDLRTYEWKALDIPGGGERRGSWNRGILDEKASRFLIFGSKDSDMLEDYNKRATNYKQMIIIDLEAYGVYRAPTPQLSYQQIDLNLAVFDEGLGADMDVICEDGKRIGCSRKVLEDRWPWFAAQRARYSTLAASSFQITASSTYLKPTSSSPISPTASAISPLASLPLARLRNTQLHLPEPYPVVLALLQYFYTLALTQPVQNTPPVLSALLVLAKQYDMPDLTQLVVHRMHEALTPQLADGIAEVAALCGCEALLVHAWKVAGRRESGEVRAALVMAAASRGGGGGGSGSSSAIGGGGGSGSGSRRTSGNSSVQGESEGRKFSYGESSGGQSEGGGAGSVGALGRAGSGKLSSSNLPTMDRMPSLPRRTSEPTSSDALRASPGHHQTNFASHLDLSASLLPPSPGRPRTSSTGGVGLSPVLPLHVVQPDGVPKQRNRASSLSRASLRSPLHKSSTLLLNGGSGADADSDALRGAFGVLCPSVMVPPPTTTTTAPGARPRRRTSSTTVDSSNGPSTPGDVGASFSPDQSFNKAQLSFSLSPSSSDKRLSVMSEPMKREVSAGSSILDTATELPEEEEERKSNDDLSFTRTLATRPRGNSINSKLSIDIAPRTAFAPSSFPNDMPTRSVTPPTISSSPPAISPRSRAFHESNLLSPSTITSPSVGGDSAPVSDDGASDSGSYDPNSSSLQQEHRSAERPRTAVSKVGRAFSRAFTSRGNKKDAAAADAAELEAVAAFDPEEEAEGNEPLTLIFPLPPTMRLEVPPKSGAFRSGSSPSLSASEASNTSSTSPSLFPPSSHDRQPDTYTPGSSAISPIPRSISLNQSLTSIGDGGGRGLLPPPLPPMPPPPPRSISDGSLSLASSVTRTSMTSSGTSISSNSKSTKSRVRMYGRGGAGRAFQIKQQKPELTPEEKAAKAKAKAVKKQTDAIKAGERAQFYFVS